MMPDTNDGRTHWDGCWRDPEHWKCAVAEIERLRSQRVTLSSTIEVLSLSVRTRNALDRGRFSTIGDIVNVDLMSLCSVRGFGVYGLRGVVQELRRHGFRLRDTPPAINPAAPESPQ